jgi:hypothetical protein
MEYHCIRKVIDSPEEVAINYFLNPRYFGRYYITKKLVIRQVILEDCIQRVYNVLSTCRKESYGRRYYYFIKNPNDSFCPNVALVYMYVSLSVRDD